MDLEQQVCSLELAKELKGLGVEQGAYWGWHWQEYSDEFLLRHAEGEYDCCSLCCSAFTVAELGELLPEYFYIWRGQYKDVMFWYGADRMGGKDVVSADTEVNAKAKLLIWHLTKKAEEIDDDCKAPITDVNGCCTVVGDVSGDTVDCDDAAAGVVVEWIDGRGRVRYGYEGDEGVPEKWADNVNHPEHYTSGGIETIDFIEAKGLGFHLGNVVKYIARAGKKDSDTLIQDLEKARWYLDRAIENDGDA